MDNQAAEAQRLANSNQLAQWIRTNWQLGEERLRQSALLAGYSMDQFDSVFAKARYEQQLHDSAPAAPLPKSNAQQPPHQENPRQSRFILAVATVVILGAAIAGAMWWFTPQRKTITPTVDFSKFSLLVIDQANAMGNFTLEPEESDSLGVTPSSSYILKSKAQVQTALVKSNLKIEPASAYNLQEVSSTEWRIVPATALAPNALVKITLTTSYIASDGAPQERDYSWAYQIRDHFKILSSIPRQAATYVPVNTGIEITFSHENITNIDTHFSIEPVVNGRFEHHGRTVVFVPATPLNQKTLYTVTVKKGLPLIGTSDTLADDYAFTFETEQPNRYGSNQPWIQVQDLVDAGTADAPLVQVYGGNIPNNTVEVSVYELGGWQGYLAALEQRDRLPWWSMAKQNYLQDVSTLPRRTSFTVTTQTDRYVQFVRFPSPQPIGYYVAEFRVGDARDQTLLQVTDLSAYLNIAKDQTIVWVNDLHKNTPVGGTTIGFPGTTAPEAQTGNDGIARLTTPPEFVKAPTNTSETKRYYLKAQRAEQTVIIPSSYLTGYYGGASYTESAREADDYWRYLYTDRPRYQTTDTIKFWGMVKLRQGGQAIPKGVSVTLYKEGYVDYYYQPVRIMEQEVALTDAGTFLNELKFTNLRPDYYTLELRVEGTTVLSQYLEIQPYTKPAYELTLTPDRTVAYAGDTINLTAKASFFEGTPVPNLKLNYETPNGKQEVTTDAAGQAQLTYSKPYQACEGSYCWPSAAWLNVQPASSELAETSASANVQFYGPSVYTRSQVQYPSRGTAAVKIITRAVDLTTVTANSPDAPGAVLSPGTKVDGTLTQVTYHRQQTGTAYDFISKRTYQTYTYTTERKEIDTFSVVTDERGSYTYQRATQPDTSYVLKLKTYDTKGRYEIQEQYFYYYNGATAEQVSESDTPYYHLDATENIRYSIGDQVTINFLNNNTLLPTSDVAHYLFLQFQNGLQDYRATTQPTYRFTYEKRDVPNVDILGVYFNGKTYVTTGFAQVKYKIDDRRLRITVSPDKLSYEPAGTVGLAVDVADSSGRPVAAEVNLNLIDEAFYAVANEYAAPLEAVYAPVATGSIFSTSSHIVPYSPYGGAEMGGCFGPGTRITMEDGMTKPIEQVKIGDRILTLANPLRTETVAGVVSETFQHVVDEYLVINSSLRVTPEHRVYANQSFRTAGELKVGDWMLGLEGRRIRVDAITKKHGALPVYNLRVEPQHSFIADGYYVHNDKGGEAVRQFFTDVAVFQAVHTDANGHGRTSFTLPDNITSWRVTVQAISPDLGVGISVSKIPVSLPVFADVTVGSEYLSVDRPVARLRAFGAALSSDDAVTFSVAAPSLGLREATKLETTAFTPAYLTLPELTVGKHEVTYRLTTPKGGDAVKLPLSALSSRLTAHQVIFSGKLTTETKLGTDDNQPLVVVLSDEGKNILYAPLVALSASWGDRVDQALTRKQAIEVLNTTYKESYLVPTFNASQYQLTDGGITLLPYSSSDLSLSAHIAAVANDEFDLVSLRQYLFTKLESKSSTPEEITLALYGLASLGEPVLTRLGPWLQRQDLTPIQQLYLGLAASKLGAGELARGTYLNVMSSKAVTRGSEIALKVSDNADEVAAATALASNLASQLGAPERDGLWRYLVDHPTKDVLLNLEKLSYIRATLPLLRPSPARVTYTLAGKREQTTITGSIHSFRVEPTQLPELTFTEVEGDVGIATSIVRPVRAEEMAKSTDIGIRRAYLVNGQPTNSFHETDLVEVRLYPVFSAQAPDYSYQITDLLPSGLLPVTKLYTGMDSYEDCHYWHPYQTEGQRVHYSITKGWQRTFCGGDYISYFARVKTRGTYTSEPTIIQSFLDPDTINHGEAQVITIEP